MLKWLKRLQAIVANYDTDMRNTHKQIAQLDKVIHDRTDIAVDIRLNSSYVIVAGHYKNTDYVQTFRLDTQDFADLIDRLKHLEKHGTIRRIDAPPLFRAAFAHRR